MGQLDDKTSLVTGASSGIGLSIARRFAAEGATVYLTGRRKAELDTAVARVGACGIAIQGDASDLGDLDRLYAEIAKRSGRLDIVVANAGAGGYGLVTVAGAAVIGKQQLGDAVDAGVEIREGAADLVTFDLVQAFTAGHAVDAASRCSEPLDELGTCGGSPSPTVAASWATICAYSRTAAPSSSRLTCLPHNGANCSCGLSRIAVPHLASCRGVDLGEQLNPFGELVTDHGDVTAGLPLVP
jgi:NAD(P)-dependent dehydrogenase (short-subunit alcohol dehydrogenase family)